MSSEPFIKARGIGKKYALYGSPLQRLGDLVLDTGSAGEHWAVRGVDLELGPGDCVGIVGRNGAGKSTLLEMICGISRPSEGRLETRGRVAALLQLGAGFNPEFTGRENVMLGAAIYGLPDAEIAARLPDIRAFADIGDYFERPVREYSSGMYARLAFSVCAHVDPDILVVDEILGIGDVAFQQKSMRFLRRFRRRGITLFVSHNEHAVAALCESAVWMDRGRVVARGGTREVLYRYRRELQRLAMQDARFEARDGAAAEIAELPVAAATRRPTEFDLDEPAAAAGLGAIEEVVVSADGVPLAALEGGERIGIAVTLRADGALEAPFVLVVLRNPMGQALLACDSRDAARQPESLGAGDRARFSFAFDLPFLPTGSYPLEIHAYAGAGEPACVERREAAAVMQVLSAHISHGMANLRMKRTLLEVVHEPG